MLRPSVFAVLYISMFVIAPSLADERDIGALCEQTTIGGTVTINDKSQTAADKLSKQFKYASRKGMNYATYDRFNRLGVYENPTGGDVVFSFIERKVRVVQKKEHRIIMSQIYLELPSMSPTSKWPSKHISLVKDIEVRMANICDKSRNNVPRTKRLARLFNARIKEGDTLRKCNTSNTAHGPSAYVVEKTQRSNGETYTCKYELSLSPTSNKNLFFLMEQFTGYSEALITSKEGRGR